MTNDERDLQLRLQAEQIDRLERAVGELAQDLHGVSGGAGRPAVASVLADRRERGERLETTMRDRRLSHAG